MIKTNLRLQMRNHCNIVQLLKKVTVREWIMRIPLRTFSK